MVNTAEGKPGFKLLYKLDYVWFYEYRDYWVIEDRTLIEELTITTSDTGDGVYLEFAIADKDINDIEAIRSYYHKDKFTKTVALNGFIRLNNDHKKEYEKLKKLHH